MRFSERNRTLFSVCIFSLMMILQNQQEQQPERANKSNQHKMNPFLRYSIILFYLNFPLK